MEFCIKALKKKTIKSTGKNKKVWTKNSGIVFGNGVSMLIPLGWVKSGTNAIASDQMYVKSDIRIIDKNCERCKKVESSKKYLCPIFIDGKCNQFHYMSDEDIILQKEGSIITNTWRTFTELPQEHENILRIMSNVIDKRKNEEENQRIFDECISVGLGDLQQKITQIFDQRVYKKKKVVEDLRGLDADALMVKEREKQRGQLKREREKTEKELALQRAEMRAEERKLYPKEGEEKQ